MEAGKICVWWCQTRTVAGEDLGVETNVCDGFVRWEGEVRVEVVGVELNGLLMAAEDGKSTGRDVNLAPDERNVRQNVLEASPEIGDDLLLGGTFGGS